MNKADLKSLRAIRRTLAIESNNLAAYRMVGKRIAPKRGKGAVYDRRSAKAID